MKKLLSLAALSLLAAAPLAAQGIAGTWVTEFDRDRGFNVRPRPTAFNWRSWARYACDNYSPRTYWVVTAEDGGRLCP